ncbi:MAG: enoyl-CoA hydratase/isomerase family protein [Myxococcota bacterium]
MPTESLDVERSGPLLHVWLSRPKQLNPISTSVLRELGDLFRNLETDFDIRAVVLGGRGRSFSAGADRRERREPDEGATERERRWFSQLGRRACQAIEDCEVPTIARVQGHALGGGFCLAQSCDFRVAAEDAEFGLPEVELGLPLTWGAVPRLIHEIGAARARELVMLGTRIDGRRAAEIGLVHRAVPAAELDDAVAQLAEQVLALPELAVHMTKTQLRGYARRDSLGDASEADGDLLGQAFQSPTLRERFRL